MVTMSVLPTNSHQSRSVPDAFWKQKLQARGLLDAALAAGVRFYNWTTRSGHTTPGWLIPLYDEHGQPLHLPDGRPAQHWKNLDSNGTPKYRFGYPDSPSGQTKPDGCDIYIPGIDIRTEVAQAQGTLIIACGQPDCWTFLAVGKRNVISFFGENNIPADLPDVLQGWGVQRVVYYADRDDTGLQSALKLQSFLAFSPIEMTAYCLPESFRGQPIKDINDLYCACDHDAEAFQSALESLPVDFAVQVIGNDEKVVESPPQAPPLLTGAQPERELPEGFYQAIEVQLGVRHYAASGWSYPVACPCRAHEKDAHDPAAHWHQEKHILHCFKCGRHFLAIEVGAALGLDWRDYRETQRPFTRDTVEKGDFPLADPDPSDAGQVRRAKPTDDEIGSRLLQTWNGQFAYFRENWHRYEAGRWQPEANINKLIWDEMINAKSEGLSPSSSRQKSIEAFLIAQLKVPNELVDCPSAPINLRNGVYHHETGMLEPHRPEQYLTTQLSFTYDPTAECPIWLECLAQWLTSPTGAPDSELIQLLQEGVGYSLTADTELETAFMLYGPAGSGKSRVIQVLQELLGSAHLSLNLSDLNRNAYQLADLPGKRAVTCTEAASGSILADATFKQLVSGEEMVIRQIYQPSFRYAPRAKVWWAVNERPQNLDRSNAVYRRLKIIPFHRAIPEAQQDRKLSEKLKQELPGIFNWALTGLARLRQQGGF